MNDPIILVAVIGGFVSAVVAALAYLGTRGSTRVAREREIGEREDRYVARLEVQVAALQAREAEREASASARLAGGLVVDAAVSEARTHAAEVVEKTERAQTRKSRRGATDDPSH